MPRSLPQIEHGTPAILWASTSEGDADADNERSWSPRSHRVYAALTANQLLVFSQGVSDEEPGQLLVSYTLDGHSIQLRDTLSFGPTLEFGVPIPSLSGSVKHKALKLEFESEDDAATFAETLGRLEANRENTLQFCVEHKGQQQRVRVTVGGLHTASPTATRARSLSALSTLHRSRSQLRTSAPSSQSAHSVRAVGGASGGAVGAAPSVLVTVAAFGVEWVQEKTPGSWANLRSSIVAVAPQSTLAAVPSCVNGAHFAVALQCWLADLVDVAGVVESRPFLEFLQLIDPFRAVASESLEILDYSLAHGATANTIYYLPPLTLCEMYAVDNTIPPVLDDTLGLVTSSILLFALCCSAWDIAHRCSELGVELDVWRPIKPRSPSSASLPRRFPPDEKKRTGTSTCAHIAAAVGAPPDLVVELTKMIESNETDVAGYTVLMYAAMEGHSQTVAQLLSEGLCAADYVARVHRSDLVGVGVSHGSVLARGDGHLPPQTSETNTSEYESVDAVQLAVACCHEDVFFELKSHCSRASLRRRVGPYERNLLHTACALGLERVAVALLNSGLDPNLRDGEGASAVLLSAKNGHISVVRRTAAYDGDYTLGEQASGLTPLHYLCLSSQRLAASEAVSVFLESLAASSAPLSEIRCAKGSTPLHAAALADSAAVASMLVSAEPHLSLCRDGRGRTALHYAASRSSYGVMDVLLRAQDHSLLLDVEDADGTTALSAASWSGDEIAVARLLTAGANPNILDKPGRAVAFRVDDAVDTGAESWPVSPHVGYLAPKVAIPVVYIPPGGLTALHVACLVGAVECVRALIACPVVDLLAGNKMGYTPAHVAAAVGQTPVLDVLATGLRARTEFVINAKDVHLQTPLFHAVQHEQVESVEWLLDRGANTAFTDGKGRSVMSYANQEIQGILSGKRSRGSGKKRRSRGGSGAAGGGREYSREGSATKSKFKSKSKSKAKAKSKTKSKHKAKHESPSASHGSGSNKASKNKRSVSAEPRSPSVPHFDDELAATAATAGGGGGQSSSGVARTLSFNPGGGRVKSTQVAPDTNGSTLPAMGRYSWSDSLSTTTTSDSDSSSSSSSSGSGSDSQGRSADSGRSGGRSRGSRVSGDSPSGSGDMGSAVSSSSREQGGGRGVSSLGVTSGRKQRHKGRGGGGLGGSGRRSIAQVGTHLDVPGRNFTAPPHLLTDSPSLYISTDDDIEPLQPPSPYNSPKSGRAGKSEGGSSPGNSPLSNSTPRTRSAKGKGSRRVGVSVSASVVPTKEAGQGGNGTGGGLSSPASPARGEGELTGEPRTPQRTPQRSATVARAKARASGRRSLADRVASLPPLTAAEALSDSSSSDLSIFERSASKNSSSRSVSQAAARRSTANSRGSSQSSDSSSLESF